MGKRQDSYDMIDIASQTALWLASYQYSSHTHSWAIAMSKVPCPTNRHENGAGLPRKSRSLCDISDF